jgi:SAM-dependent methyltransferase
VVQELPFQAASFDCVLSTPFFHHLPTATRRAALREVLRVLRPAGELHVMDFGPPSGWGRWAIFTALRAFDGFDNTADNAKGLLPMRMREAGFEDVRELARIDTQCGLLPRAPAASAPVWLEVTESGFARTVAPRDSAARRRGPRVLTSFRVGGQVVFVARVLTARTFGVSRALSR